MTVPHTTTSRTFNLLLILGLLLAIFPMVVSSDSLFMIFDRLFSAHPSALLQGLLMPIMMLLGWLHGFSFMIGTVICFWCAGRFLLRPERPVMPAAVLIPLLCDGYVFAQALPFLAVPRGAGIRPMGWVFFTLLLACGMTVFGLVYVTGQFRTQQNKAFCGIGIFLSLLPIPIMMSSLRLMAAIKGFELEP